MVSSVVALLCFTVLFFFCSDTVTSEIYTLSLHDALPISSPGPVSSRLGLEPSAFTSQIPWVPCRVNADGSNPRSEEHTSELQSRVDLVCRLLLEKKKKENSNEVSHEEVKDTHRISISVPR